MGRAYADVEFTERQNDRGFMQACVVVACCDSGDETFAWGHGPASVRRALTELSSECSCGATFHAASDDQDEDDF